MKVRLPAGLFVVTGFLSLLLAAPMPAHHSWGAYDLNKVITLKGTVLRFNWSNPHISLEVNVKQASGALQTWVAGGPSPSRMSRGGWDRDTVKLGDPITVVGNPSKDGSLKMRLGKVTLASGQELIVYGNR
jgi:hypothetical protein